MVVALAAGGWLLGKPSPDEEGETALSFFFCFVL
jgi:hypothetical protein